MFTSGRHTLNISNNPSPSSLPLCRSEGISLITASTKGNLPSSELHGLGPSSRFLFSSQEDTDDALSDEYVAALAERMASFTFQEEEDGGSTEQSTICQNFLPSSPQSILTGCGQWNNGLNRKVGGFASPCSSGICSPPSPPSNLAPLEDDHLDSLYVELMRLRMERELRLLAAADAALIARAHMISNLTHDRRLDVCDVPMGNGVCNLSSAVDQKVTDEFEAVKTHKSTWPLQIRHHQSHATFKPTAGMPWCQYPSYRLVNASSGVLPQHATRNGSGMRAVFLNARGSCESGGTGVFLPRRIGHSPGSRRKSGCSTVLLPSHIVEALNLNIEDTCGCPVSASVAVKSSSQGPPCAKRSGYGHANLDSLTGSAPSPSDLGKDPPDINLPSEWMY